MTYDFNNFNGFDLKTSSLAVTNFKRNRSAQPSRIMNKFWEEVRLSETKETILLLAGKYTSLVDGNIKEWKEFLLHSTPYVKGKASSEIVCTAGYDQHAKQPCTGCVYWDNGPKKENPWYPRPKVKFNALSLAAYHDNVPYIKDGKPAIKDDGKPSLIKQKCAGKGCHLCTSLGKPSTFGRLMKVVLTGTHFGQLTSFNKKTLNNLCSGCGKTIVVNEYSCSSCDKQLLDVSNNSYSAEQLDRFAKSPQTCECGHVGLPKEGLDCGFDEDGQIKEVEDCPLDYPIRMNIFNTVLSLSKEGEKTKSSLYFGERRSIYANSKIKYMAPNKQSITEILNTAIAANNGSLFDLDAETYTNTTAEQAAIIGDGIDPYAEVNAPSMGSGGFPINFTNMSK